MSLYRIPVQRSDFQPGSLYDYIYLPGQMNDEVLEQVDVVLLSLTSEKNLSKVRQARQIFSGFSEARFGHLTLADAGMFIYEEERGESVLQEFMNTVSGRVKTTLILLTDISRSFVLELGEKRPSLNVSVVTRQAHDPYGQPWKSLLFGSLALLGLHDYLIKRDDRVEWQKKNIKTLRLAQLLADEKSAEVFFRHSHVILMDASAVARSILENSIQVSAGMDAVMFATMNYLAGLSPVNQYHILDFNLWTENESAFYLALGIWHYLLGLYNKIPDFPFIEKDKLNRTVHKKGRKEEVFYFNPLSDRYWMEKENVPFSIEGLLPISKNDYYFLMKKEDDMGISQGIL